MPPVRRWIRRLLVACAAAFAGLVLAEGALAVFFPQPIYDIYIRDAVRGHRLEASAVRHCRTAEYRVEVRTNALGIRDREIGPKRAGERRLLCLGDSFTHGAQVSRDETFCQVLERSLGEPWEVVNAGIPGYETAHERIFLHNDLWGLEPDAVLVNFYQNDVTGWRVGADGDRLRLLDGNGAFLPAPSWHSRIRNRLCSRSHLYYIVWRALRDAHVWREAPDAQADPEAWSATEGNLRALVEECRAHSIPVGVAVLPWYGRVLQESVDRNDVHRRVPEVCAAIGVPYLDLLPSFLEDGRASLYYRIDGHFAHDGHALAAQEIERFIREQGWVR
ncbi:MAG: hypothetical protein HY608_06660 [Planctomycetes bacterium]|nr:hypothetical protein [Planctomycetota bacterium]